MPTDTANEPYCSNCGYRLTGLTESSKCPECGKPIVEVLTRRSMGPQFGRRYRSRATLFGWPVIHIALGPRDGELRGKARGIIAIGDIATGGLAIGGVAFGVVACGGVAMGACAIGGLAVGLLTALGGLAIGGIAVGGGAVGVIATGGGAFGYVAQGGGAFGVHTRDARTRVSPPGAIFEQLSWLLGRWPPGPLSPYQPLLVSFLILLAVAALIGAAALFALLRDRAADRSAT